MVVLSISSGSAPDVGHISGMLSVKNGDSRFSLCGGTIWKLDGGPAYSELMGLYEASAKNESGEILVTLYATADRIEMPKNPSKNYWAVAEVQQVIEVHDGLSCTG